jgi:hypothetical protein
MRILVAGASGRVALSPVEAAAARKVDFGHARLSTDKLAAAYGMRLRL